MKSIDTILQIRLGDEYLGVDSDICNHILRVPIITSIPLTKPSLRGIVVLNGKIVPVLDLKTLFEMGTVDTTQEQSRIVTLQLDKEEIAILVDEVIDALSFNPQNYEENLSSEEAIVGFYKNDNTLIEIFEPA